MNKKPRKKLFLSTICIFFVLIVGFFLYTSQYYHADSSVKEYVKDTKNVKVISIKEGLFLDGKGMESALIFYPGGKVDEKAYLPLLMKIADQGVDCFLVKMPFHLAFFGMNQADNLLHEYDYKHWYMSGHSLGGAMAAYYASSHLDKLDGLVLLAAYPTKSLKTDTFSVLSLYGSEDHVLNMERMKEGDTFMPMHYTKICIEGGNHGQFGNYGQQKGDGIATISSKEQQKQSIDAILTMIKEKE